MLRHSTNVVEYIIKDWQLVEFYTAQSTVGIQLYDRVPVLTLI